MEERIVSRITHKSTALQASREGASRLCDSSATELLTPPGLVLLIVILARMGRIYYSNPEPPTNGAAAITPPEKLQCVYIVAAHPFPEVDEFVKTSSAEYGLEVARYVLPMKKGLEIYLEERPSIKAVFVGTRRTDPHGENLTFFDPTDAGWPSFMRIHPVIDWHYGMYRLKLLMNQC